MVVRIMVEYRLDCVATILRVLMYHFHLRFVVQRVREELERALVLAATNSLIPLVLSPDLKQE